MSKSNRWFGIMAFIIFAAFAVLVAMLALGLNQLVLTDIDLTRHDLLARITKVALQVFLVALITLVGVAIVWALLEQAVHVLRHGEFKPDEEDEVDGE